METLKNKNIDQNSIFNLKKFPIRIITATSLFDGHDSAINLIRRLLQSCGAEVIHLGHNCSAEEIAISAIQEDVNAVAVSSYQGGHLEFYPYLRKLLDQKGGNNIKIFGGGGGVITPEDIEYLEKKGIEKIYTPQDGRSMGLEGMIQDVIQRCSYKEIEIEYKNISPYNHREIARVLTAIENQYYKVEIEKNNNIVIGITGPGGCGKSCITDELIRRFLIYNPEFNYAILCIDPTKRKFGGALLGDRIRMNSVYHPHIYLRSIATREKNIAINQSISLMVQFLKNSNFDYILIETAGIGQSDSSITEIANITIYVMTPEYGAPSQLEKIDMIDYADLIIINKFDKSGSLDALRDVRKQYKRSRNVYQIKDEDLPIFGTITTHYNDPTMNYCFDYLCKLINTKYNKKLKISNSPINIFTKKDSLIPETRNNYLRDIKHTLEKYHEMNNQISSKLRKLQSLKEANKYLKEKKMNENLIESLNQEIIPLEEEIKKLIPEEYNVILNWEEKINSYKQEEYILSIRDKEKRYSLYSETLSHLKIPKIATPKYHDWGDIYIWLKKENFPGNFPFTAGIFPFQRDDEDPTRMFAGEGTPIRTNKRFHYLTKDMPFNRLSTAFDSVTLYGEDPDKRPDIYGKIGNSGVSISNLDDMKKLYAGFDLCDPDTSVSMTINGPAPIMLAMFFNTAIDQQVEKYLIQIGESQKLKKWNFVNINQPYYKKAIIINGQLLGYGTIGTNGHELVDREIYENIKKETLKKIRGTVQADILKEDQAQNTCIFSIEFALRLMADMQQYYIDHQIKNHYSVSISGYHMAEAGANPITQLTFTLANAFTYVEYYLSRGMSIDDFIPNFSFFFSNGMDAEYSVLGRVARRIWAIAMKYKYNASEKSQKLKYHIQTSGRSLHSFEIDFNDIRTTLQALIAIYDRCNSLHTNAYDEAITTPTEESVRRAMAIQLIINKELGLNKNHNPLQGSFIIEELTDLVEKAVLEEFQALAERGNVLGGMERMYQRSKIQEESLYYEELKHSGKLPIIGVNTFINPYENKNQIQLKQVRSTDEEKEEQIRNLYEFKKRNINFSKEKLAKLFNRAIQNQNIFYELMECVKYCSLGEITQTLYRAGGKYRRNM